ncbi:hypothetical protein GALL_547400 [mine drainage metagenome]|uniref:DUF1840 domain-containing protein n=1 Tax=mine drainage metagenome TaxID=410659 RepID=A0A1J5NZP1_9ZZZZ
MLYKFKSRNTGDIIMLQTHAEHILEIIGRDIANGNASQGILVSDQIPAAVAALQAAITDEDSARAAAVAQALANHEPPPKFSELALRQRAQPLIEMLGRCQKTGDDVVWGV